MLQEACSLCTDVTSLGRLQFASVNLNKDTPGYWEIVTKFGFRSASAIPSCEKVKLLCENIGYVEDEAFVSKEELKRELLSFEGFQGHPLGIVLISANTKCISCGGALLIRADRPSFPVIYSEDFGTVNGTHFRKYCQNSNKGCGFTQHYGFHSHSAEKVVYEGNVLIFLIFCHLI